MTKQSNRDYRGKRALMLLRVSTSIQEEMYGWPAQEKEIRDKLIIPLNLRLDEDRHIIRDRYTGLEFRERPALDRVLEMANRHEIDILCMDVLDRLGRKGLAREIYRMQLRELGIIILTTDPNEHADDDTLMGEMIRLLKGYQAEEELNNIRRRTMNGRRVKAEGQKNGDVYTVLPKVVGSGTPLYGYTWTYSEKGRREGYILDHEVIKVDENDVEWTKVKVVIFVFDSIASGKTIRQIAKSLNDKGIPGPKGGLWHTAAISRMGRNKTYWTGELALFRERVVESIPGNKHGIREKVPEAEQVKVPVPQIIDRELAEIVQKKLEHNKQIASRNNKKPHESLLRAGLAKCGHCGGNMSFYRTLARVEESGNEVYYTQYYCKSGGNVPGKCLSASMNAAVVDKAAWEYTVAIIRDPSQVDKRINALRSEDPTANRRKQIKSKLAEIRGEQAALREQLATLIAMRKLDPRTEDFLTERLNQLVDQEDGYQRELARDEDEHSNWKKMQAKLDELHEICADMRDRLDDPGYTPSYEIKRELCEFFGICAVIWKKGYSPRFKIQCNPPSIVSLLLWRRSCRSHLSPVRL